MIREYVSQREAIRKLVWKLATHPRNVALVHCDFCGRAQDRRWALERCSAGALAYDHGVGDIALDDRRWVCRDCLDDDSGVFTLAVLRWVRDLLWARLGRTRGSKLVRRPS